MRLEKTQDLSREVRCTTAGQHTVHRRVRHRTRLYVVDADTFEGRQFAVPPALQSPASVLASASTGLGPGSATARWPRWTRAATDTTSPEGFQRPRRTGLRSRPLVRGGRRSRRRPIQRAPFFSEPQLHVSLAQSSVELLDLRGQPPLAIRRPVPGAGLKRLPAAG